MAGIYYIFSGTSCYDLQLYELFRGQFDSPSNIGDVYSGETGEYYTVTTTETAFGVPGTAIYVDTYVNYGTCPNDNCRCYQVSNDVGPGFNSVSYL